MGVPMNSICFECQLKKKLALARSLGTDEEATVFAERMMQELVNAPKDMDSTRKQFAKIYKVDPIQDE